VNTARINELIKHVQKTLHITSVVVTHDLSTAFGVSDRIVLLNKGRVAYIGTPSDVKTTKDELVRSFIEGRVAAYEDVRSLLAS